MVAGIMKNLSQIIALLCLCLFGCGPANSGDSLYDEANALYKAGKYREAKEKMILAYADVGSSDKDRVLHLRSLSGISLGLQENDKAIEYANEILAHAGNDDDRGVAYNNLGLAYANKGEYDRAIGYYEKALAIQLKSLGPEHPSVGLSYNNLGSAYYNKGEYDRAIGYYEKALAIALKSLGPEHPDVGLSYNNLGLAYAQKGDKVKGMGYLLKAKAICIKRLGPDHPNTKTVQATIDGFK